MDLGSILPSLFENFARLSPIRAMVILDFQRGVKFHCGRFSKVLGPGIHFYINWLQHIHRIVVVSQCVESDMLTLTTKDGKSVILSVAIQYSVPRPDLYWLKVQNFDSSLLNMVEGECSRVVAMTDAADILADPQAVADRIADYARKTSAQWGAAIENVSLPNLAIAKTYRLVGDGISYPLH